MSVLRPRHVRTRLTLWYLVVFGAILTVYIAGTSTFLYFSHLETLDDNLGDAIEGLEPLIQLAPDGALRFAANSEQPDPDRQQHQYLEILTPDGRTLYRNPALHSPLGGHPFPGEGVSGYSQRSSRLADGSRIRIGSRLHEVGDRKVLIRLAVSEEPLWRELKEFLTILWLGLPVVLAIAGFVGYGLARRILKPLGEMAQRAEKLTAENLHDRLPVENPEDELGQLAQVFNHALERLEGSFEQLRRFTADASHELRTPLTAIRSVGEVGMQGQGSASYYREVIGSMLEEANRLTRLVESLLTISRADAGHIRLNHARLPLVTLAGEAAGLLEMLAEEKSAKLTVAGDPSIAVNGDRLILRQAVLNLLDNAIKYSPPGGTVSVKVSRKENEAVLEVGDSGPGIPKQDQEKVFDRFYRVDEGRSREAGGTGLGLSITRWAVEAHGGKISLISEEGHGSTFRISLPVVEVDRFATVG